MGHTSTKIRKIDEKHHIEIKIIDQCLQPIIFKTTNNTVVEEDEPTILFRGRDNLAVEMLEFYRSLCVREGCTSYQLQSMDTMINRFKEFAATSSTMKQPGVTKGL